jgi:Lon protease-like protein
LGSVLFPGLVLPLHVFEERYRALVRDLVDLPEGEPREFGVVAIRRGWEVDGASGDGLALFEVGCTAELRQVTELDDGRMDIVTVGRRRFHVDRLLDAGTPYLKAEVTYLPEPAAGDPDAERLAPQALARFRAYLGLIRTDGGEEVTEQLPEDPTVLSHLIAATASLTLADRQALLAEPDTAGRLRAELRLLHREVGLLRQVRAVPVPVSELPARPGPN